MVPSVVSLNPSIILNVVVLPAPFLLETLTFFKFQRNIINCSEISKFLGDMINYQTHILYSYQYDFWFKFFLI